MFTMQTKKAQLTTLEKAIALSVVTALLLVGVVVLGKLSGSDSGSANASYSSCESRYDSTPCPEPDYSQPIDDSKKYPDATP